MSHSRWARGVTVLAAAAAIGLLTPGIGDAAPPPDPYVDAVDPATGVPVTDGAALTGAPDGRYAQVSGRFGGFLVLDLGAGELGRGALEVHYSNPRGTFVQQMDVHFLDGSRREVGRGQLIMGGFGEHVTTVTNSSAEPYRYLSILTGIQEAGFDSMRAAALA